MIIAVYNNSHSYDLINQFLKNLSNNKEEVILINTGLIPLVTSNFCNRKFNLFKNVINLIKFKQFFLKNKNKITKIIIPNTNNLLCGFLHSNIKNNQYSFYLVEEGTRNFHMRPLTLIGRTKRLAKFLITKLFFINYYYNNHDEFEIIGDYKVITSFPDLQISTSEQFVVQENYKKYTQSSNIILILGSHILDQSHIKFEINPFLCLKDNKYSTYRKIYLPHPRSDKKGKNETKLLDKCIDYDKDITSLNADDFIKKFKPKYTFSLGGSSTFFYYNRKQCHNLYVLGIETLIKHGHAQYKELRDIYESLGVNIV